MDVFEAEGRWFAGKLALLPAEALSPLVNLGSSTRDFRTREQPWIERDLFAPLLARGIRVVHCDMREGDGIDIRADLTREADIVRVKALAPRAVFCCNMLEHVVDRDALAKACIALAGPGGLIFVSVPRSYPYHRDPIDTMYRPDTDDLARLFAGADMVAAEIVDSGLSYRDQVRRRPFLLFRHLFRAPFPFLGLAAWRRSMQKLHWLRHNYLVTCAVFRAGGKSRPPPL